MPVSEDTVLPSGLALGTPGHYEYLPFALWLPLASHVRAPKRVAAS